MRRLAAGAAAIVILGGAGATLAERCRCTGR